MPTNLEGRQRKLRHKAGAHEIKLVYGCCVGAKIVI